MILLLCIVFGIAFGSFVNAWVWRTHERTKPVTKRAKGNLSIMTGRSVCTHCGHVLGPLDLIPVISWVSLRGKCRYCKKAISVQYPLVELVTGVLFGLSYIAWTFDGWVTVAQFGLWLAGLVLLVAMAVYDIRWMELPDNMVAMLTVVAVVFVALRVVEAGNMGPLFGAALGIMSLAGVFFIIFQVSNGKWIGGGDVKLGVPLGLLVGSFIGGLFVLFVASVIGLAVSLPLLRKDRNKMMHKVPFGPFLIAATILVCLYGAQVVAWYQGQLLLL